MIDGVILVQKPCRLTSHDVVDRIRKIFSIRKVGHFGTLDPLATGLLLVGIGRATRLFPFFSGLDKAYIGSLTFGTATDTYDSEGRPTGPGCREFPPRSKIDRALEHFRGAIRQIPPPFSAKKIGGKPSYLLAREKKSVQLEAVPVTIHAFSPTEYLPPVLDFEVECSSGTYIRSLAHDLGRQLSCGAHLTRLVRTRIGRFSLEDSHTLETLETAASENRTHQVILPMEQLFPEWTKITLTNGGAALASNGNLITPEDILSISALNSSKTSSHSGSEPVLRLFNTEGRLLAFARKHPEKTGLHPFLVVGDANNHA